MHTPLSQKIKNVAEAARVWVLAGMPITSSDQHSHRVSICHANTCGFYDPAAYKNTGGCNACGCSTEAKAWLATESCPKKLW